MICNANSKQIEYYEDSKKIWEIFNQEKMSVLDRELISHACINERLKIAFFGSKLFLKMSETFQDNMKKVKRSSECQVNEFNLNIKKIKKRELEEYLKNIKAHHWVHRKNRNANDIIKPLPPYYQPQLHPLQIHSINETQMETLKIFFHLMPFQLKETQMTIKYQFGGLKKHSTNLTNDCEFPLSFLYQLVTDYMDSEQKFEQMDLRKKSVSIQFLYKLIRLNSLKFIDRPSRNMFLICIEILAKYFEFIKRDRYNDLHVVYICSLILLIGFKYSKELFIEMVFFEFQSLAMDEHDTCTLIEVEIRRNLDYIRKNLSN